MTAKTYIFSRAAQNMDQMQQHHLDSCVQDVMRVASLICRGREEGYDLHSGFTRQAILLRHFHHTYAPSQPIDIEQLYQDTLEERTRHFHAEFQQLGWQPRLHSHDAGTLDEITRRVLEDSSPYLKQTAQWLQTHQESHDLELFQTPEMAGWLLLQTGIRDQRTLHQVIRDDMEQLISHEQGCAQAQRAQKMSRFKIV